MKPRHLCILFAVCCFFALAGPVSAQALSEITQPPNGANQRAEVSQWIGLVKVSIAYSSPNVHGGGGRDRTGHIWGELIPYGFFDEGFGPSRATPWRAGANENTTITFSHDVKIGGKDVKAGTYALFLKLEKSGPWTWILSTHNTGWGSYQYDPKNDALRLDAEPQAAPYTEFLTYGFDDRRLASTVAYLQWEHKRISFKIDVSNINELYAAQMRKDLQGWPGFDYRNWQAAAQFCADNKVNLEEALVWAERAITEPFRGTGPGREEFSTLQTKASVLQALGRDAEADAIGDKAIRLPGTTIAQIHQYGQRMLSAGRNQRALDIFKYNFEKHPQEKFVTYVGLARGYTAVGDKANAIKNWETAIRNIPEDRKSALPVYQDLLKKLKEGS